jgi:iron complex outermembrane receptor protein
VLWGGVSRAVRMPTRFDSDLQFTGGTPIVLLAGSPAFQSETLVAKEVGYRLLAIPKLAVGINAFWNSYDRLRSQEPTTPAPFPIVLANKGEGRTSGVEIAAHYEPAATWQIWGGFNWITEDLGFQADSRDTSAGSLEYNDPREQVWFRSLADLPHGFSLDATLRYVGALPLPAIAAYTELTLHSARAIGHGVELEIVGDNLLHDRHVEWKQLGPAHSVPRSVYVGLIWRQ